MCIIYIGDIPDNPVYSICRRVREREKEKTQTEYTIYVREQQEKSVVYHCNKNKNRFCIQKFIPARE